MSSNKRYQLDNFRKSLLNRVTVNPAFTDYIENCLAREDDASKHSFHKIMIHNWSGTDVQLFDILSEYFACTIIPVHYSSQPEITSFYTSSLNLIVKMIRLDFMFPFQRNMFNIDILFNHKTSADCFMNSVTIDDIVSGVVSSRFNEKCELDLSDFCNDPEFHEKKINFYKVSLLSHFKLLMLRMGRDTKTLNLSNNNLVQVPLEILNFFIKGDLTAINFSNNQIPSLQELLRVSSKIEKMWLEGNPLCEELDPASYVKVITMKFPRLIELDGVRINQHGCIFPFFKNFLVTPDRRTKMLVEKFLMIYFTHYDSRRRKRFEPLYELQGKFAINTAFSEEEERDLPDYAFHTRNAMDPVRRTWMMNLPLHKMFHKGETYMNILFKLPTPTHDPTTFTVDVIFNNNKVIIIVVDGIYREKFTTKITDVNPSKLPEYRYYSFRRTFVFNIFVKKVTTEYRIVNEIFSVRPASKEQIEHSFKVPIRNLNEVYLLSPDEEEIDAIVKAFMHLTCLRRFEAEARLKQHNWDFRKALQVFMQDFTDYKVAPEMMMEEDDFSDSSSLVDDID